jgi:multidrug resistance efflux pump/GAF domain-containing protein
MTDLLSVPPATLEELRREVERLRLLHSITLEFNATLDFDRLLPQVFDRVLAAVGAAGGSLWIAEGDMLHCRLAVGGSGAKLIGAQMPVGAGFVGDVAKKQRTTMVMEAVRDPRFQEATEATGDTISTTVMATAMVAGGVTVGAIQVVDKQTGTGAFDANDRELLEGLAAAAGGAIRNAQLHGAERRAKDLAVLLEISREITATLDIDRVLQSVVNLSSQALTFDRAAIGLYDRGKCEIRAVAGAEKVDPDDPSLRDLIARAEWAAGRGEPLYLTDSQDPSSDAERLFVTIFGEDLAKDQVRSGFYLPLKDDEGILGVLLYESATPDFVGDTQREVVAILANQTGVALRNAQLYHQVPLADTLGALAAKRQALRGWSRRKVLTYAAVAAVVLLALAFVRWPLRVSGADPLFRPSGLRPVRVMVDGTVERIGVREGSRVRRGDLLAVLRATPLATDRQAKAADAATADRLASLATSRGDAAEERIQRIRADALRREVALLDEELGLTQVRAPADGMVLTPRLEERLGTSLGEGDPLLVLGRTDTLELELGVAQHDVLRIRPGQEVRLRVDALPSRTFEGRVTSVAQLPRVVEGEVLYPVRAAIPNQDGLLKAEMTAHARVLTAPASTIERVLRGPVRWARLFWWRLWA